MRKPSLIAVVVGCGLFLSASHPARAEVDVNEVIQQCYYKDWGRDQRSRLIFTMKNRSGKVTKKMEFVRYWKDYRGKDGLVSKWMLFTVAPPEYRDNNYLRITYTLASGRMPEQWVYLKRLQSVRRLSLREQDNLSWGLMGEDLAIRQPDEDEHSLLGVREEHGNITYEVESRPRLPGPAYDKYISYYVRLRSDSWEDCTLTHRDYYDARGHLFKKADYAWQQIDGAWVLSSLDIVIERAEKKPAEQKMGKKASRLFISYRFLDPEVNVGLEDRFFSQRNLRRGLR